MVPENRELEVKINATDIDEAEFVAWASSKRPYRTLQVEGWDFFYKRGEDVVRLRVPPNEPMQLTVKKRKSAQSIRDRKEIDLVLQMGSDPELVKEFLLLAGYSQDIKIFKKAEISWFRKGREEIVAAYYSAQKDIDGVLSPAKTFIEFEASKGSIVTVETAKGYLKKWLDEANAHFKTDLVPLNKSLYEFFSE